jgi:predicted RNase H-like HicB family nuclease
MLTYKAAYKFVEGGVHAQILDFPSVISCGQDLDEARRMLGSALIDMAELSLERGEALPIPNPLLTDVEFDLDEPIHLHLSASTQVHEVPAGVVVQ